jgi:SAM-dependent methyltransferase
MNNCNTSMEKSLIIMCVVCSNEEGNTEFIAKEMMFGLRHEFRYGICAECGCIQIIEPPKNLAVYYPREYYSFHHASVSLLKRWLKRIRADYALSNGSRSTYMGLGRLLNARYGAPEYVRWTQTMGLTVNSTIMDVGCGSGILLREMHNAGFRFLTGIDPFIDGDVILDEGLALLKREVSAMNDEFDGIMMHHAFEHVADPVSTLHHLARLTKRGGCILLRVPVVGEAWRTYGKNWVQLDAPRHFCIHTTRSIEILARQAGLELRHIEYDSTAFQFWASEQYQQDIPLHDIRSFAQNPSASVFSHQQMTGFQKEAERLNAEQQGDSACFYLWK